MTTFAASLRGGDPAAAVLRADRVLAAGFEQVTLEDPLHAWTWDALAARLPRGTIAAIRLFVPYPTSVKIGARAGFRLGLVDAAERAEALRQAEETIRLADERGIPHVLLPVAEVGDAEPGRVFDAYRSSVYKLLSLADRYGLRLSMTPSGRPAEVPTGGQARDCVREFSGAPLGVWLDAARLPEDIEAYDASVVDGLTVGLLASGALPERSFFETPEVAASMSSAPLWTFDPPPGVDAEVFRRVRELFEDLTTEPEDDPLFGT